jgi:hypothetical protein
MTLKDLLVVDWKPQSDNKDKLVRRIPKDKLRRVENDDPILAPLQPLIDRKVLFAAIPENFGEGSACYLINLSQLKRGK